MSTSTYYLISTLLAVALGIKPAIAFFRWYNARLRARGASETLESVKDSFIHDVATNHLPHLFNSDKKTAEGINLILAHLGLEHRVEIDEAPPIRWLPYDPSKK